MHKRRVGKWGEQLALSFLQKNHFKILRQNYHTRFGEIDIIALDIQENQLVFCEVKTRNHSNMGYPVESISLKKQRKMHNAALLYCAEMDVVDDNYRFDAIGILVCKKNKSAIIRHYKGI